MMDWLNELLVAYPWGVYLFVALAPFIQEDTAIISAAAASIAGAGETSVLFACLLVGLSASDLWKYWLGRAAHYNEWGRKAASKPAVQAAKEKVINRLGLSLVTARFVPGTRIPLYIACGFFHAPFPRVAFFVIGSAIVYAGIAFGLFHLLGEMAGERIEKYAPVVAILIVVCVIGFLVIKARFSPENRSETNEDGLKSSVSGLGVPEERS
ncbi:MAG: VTT domain-containing protein [Pseudomonadota bacterium]